MSRNVMKDPPKNLIAVFDLDGTLSNPAHRVHHITGEEADWDAFFEACDGDTPLMHTIGILSALASMGVEIIILTGRSSAVRDKTRKWLTDNKVVYHKLIMRDAGDHTHDVELKKQIAVNHGWFQNPERVVVFEDRQSVVDMWRENGLQCYQVAPGDF